MRSATSALTPPVCRGARVGFSARGTISRRAFGITFGLAADGTKIAVGGEVEITIDVEAFPAA